MRNINSICCWYLNIATDEWEGAYRKDEITTQVQKLIFLRWRFQGEVQGKKHFLEYQWYLLFPAHLDRWVTDIHRMENCSVTEQDILRDLELKVWGSFFYNFFSWKTLMGEDTNQLVVEHSPIGIPTVSWSVVYQTGYICCL